MAAPRDVGRLPEKELNGLLRRVDWRFLLHGCEAPRVADMTAGRTSLAVSLIASGEQPLPGDADLATIGYPTRLALRAAIESLRPGGEVVAVWSLPRIAAVRRAAARMRAAGLEDVRLLWPGPLPHGAAEFWLPLDDAAATAHLLARRPPDSTAKAALRPLWRVFARAGILFPLCAIGRTPSGEEPDRTLDSTLLLTGGRRSVNKVVGLRLSADGEPAAAVKFARVEAADEALEREATALRSIEAEHPALRGVPRVLEQGTRAGRRALAESVVEGTPSIERLGPDTFESLAGTVTDWLVELARDGDPRAPEEWWERLVGERLRSFERHFAQVLPAELPGRLERELRLLGPLPTVPEHRDCSPWNVVLTADGSPGLHDWESAEPRGLPGLDLAYFLANCAFVLDDALEKGQTRGSYRRLLDRTTPHGAIVARCETRYREALAIGADDLRRLRLLAWLAHSASDHTHLTMATGGAPDLEALRASTYLGLIETELDSGLSSP